VLAETAPAARLKVACRIAAKAYLAGQRVLVWHTDREELARFDELLWTFADTSFVPHEWLGAASEAPVLLSAGELPAGAVGVLINLAPSPEPPPIATAAERIVEIIAAGPGHREAGRARFRAYRQLGCEPVTHTLRAASAPYNAPDR
jgi:DNA polymerase-3 subunit chi